MMCDVIKIAVSAGFASSCTSCLAGTFAAAGVSARICAVLVFDEMQFQIGAFIQAVL